MSLEALVISAAALPGNVLGCTKWKTRETWAYSIINTELSAAWCSSYLILVGGALLRKHGPTSSRYWLLEREKCSLSLNCVKLSHHPWWRLTLIPETLTCTETSILRLARYGIWNVLLFWWKRSTEHSVLKQLPMLPYPSLPKPPQEDSRLFWHSQA